VIAPRSGPMPQRYEATLAPEVTGGACGRLTAVRCVFVWVYKLPASVGEADHVAVAVVKVVLCSATGALVYLLAGV
jgi:hypothetical protein